MSKFKKIQYNSPVVLTFTFLALVSYLLCYLTNNNLTRLLFSSYRTSVLDPLQYVRLFSYILGHVNWAHFSGAFAQDNISQLAHIIGGLCGALFAFKIKQIRNI